MSAKVVTPMTEELGFTHRAILGFITHKDTPYYVPPMESTGLVQVHKTELREPLREAFANTLRARGHSFGDIQDLYSKLPELVTFRVKHA